MAKLAKRGRATTQRREKSADPAPQRTPSQVIMERMRQGCYGISAASFVAIPAALLGEHSPAFHLLGSMGAAALLTGVTGLLIEVVEIQVFPGGKHGS